MSQLILTLLGTLVHDIKIFLIHSYLVYCTYTSYVYESQLKHVYYFIMNNEIYCMPKFV